MIGGDATQSGLINTADRLIVKNVTGTSGYNAADVTPCGIVKAVDRLLVKNNTGAQSQVH